MKRTILFIDSRYEVLDTIKGFFRNMGQAFELFYVSQVDDAYDILDQYHVEVLVAGQDLEDINITDFFVGIKHRYPEVIRVLIASTVAKKDAYKLIESVHQYILTPLEKETLKMTLFEALSYKDIMTDEAVIEIVNSMGHIPSLPVIYDQIVEKLWEDDSSIDEISDLISKDVGMSANVLHLVNSAFLGMPRNVTGIREAVGYLGVNTIRTLVLMINVFSAADKKLLKRMRLGDIWEHSFVVARISNMIAGDLGFNKDYCETCFTAGLLHCIGRIILALNFPDEYEHVVNQVHEGDDFQSIVDAEKVCFGADHCEIGAYLLGIWGLPHAISNAVLYHNCPSKTVCDSINPLVIVHLANVLANELPNRQSGPHIAFDQTMVNDLNLDKSIYRWQKMLGDLSLV